MALSKYQTRIVIVIVAVVALTGVAFGGYWEGTRKTVPVSNSSSIVAPKSTTPKTTVETNTAKSTAPKNTSPNSATPAKNSSTDTCNNLSLAKGTSDGTAGTMYWHAVITNNGTKDCSVTGYPVTTMTDDQGGSVNALKSNLYPTELVTIPANGGKAHVVLGLPNPNNLDPGTTVCTKASSSKLHLELPGVPKTVNSLFSESTCQGFTVTAIRAGI